MQIVGLTGGIASGKSTVSKELYGRGVPVIDADKLAHDERSVRQTAFKSYPVLTSTSGFRYGYKVVVSSNEANDMESMDTDSSGKRRRRKKAEQDKAPVSLENPVVLDAFVHAMKDGSKELVECFMKVLERNERQQGASGDTDNKPKDDATLAQDLVALADAVKTIAQKL